MTPTPTAPTTGPPPALMTVRALTKDYPSAGGAVHAVKEVDLDVRAGEVLLIMGPSGSGKTTLLLMLGALLRPTAGSITVTRRDGPRVTLEGADERQLPQLRARTFGFVFQDYALIGALNATENITIACNLAGMTGAEAAARADELLKRVGLDHRASFRPSHLSGGEQQRVAVARALANDPTVVLADEPTANLDAAHGRDLARLLRALADRDRRAVVIVSHDARLRDIADRVLWLEDGALAEIAALAVDPVCGMSVERTGAHLIGDDGTEYWFCSQGCKAEYAASLIAGKDDSTLRPRWSR